MTESFIKDHKLEKDLIYPFIQASNIDRWKVRWTGTKVKSDTYVLYPHLAQESKVIRLTLMIIPTSVLT